MSRRPLFAALAAGLALSLVSIVVLGAEAGLRWRERNRETVPGSMESIFYTHDRLRHALIRKNNYFGWVQVNEHGMRGASRPLVPTPGTLRIMAVGASTTFDSYVTRDDLAWPARLEGELRARMPARSNEVLNAGVPGYGVLDNTVRLQTELHRFRPDVIILYHAHNNLFGALRFGDPFPRQGDRTPGAASTQTPWGRWLGTHSLLYSKTRFLWAVRGLRETGGAPDTERLAEEQRRIREGVERFTRDLTAFVLLAREFGIRVILPEVVHVSGAQRDSVSPAEAEIWRRSTGATSARVVLEGYAAYNAAIAAVAERFGLPHIRTSSFGLAGVEWYAPDDPIHFNDRGAERMATSMADALTSTAVLAADSAR